MCKLFSFKQGHTDISMLKSLSLVNYLLFLGAKHLLYPLVFRYGSLWQPIEPLAEKL